MRKKSNISVLFDALNIINIVFKKILMTTVGLNYRESQLTLSKRIYRVSGFSMVYVSKTEPINTSVFLLRVNKFVCNVIKRLLLFCFQRLLKKSVHVRITFFTQN